MQYVHFCVVQVYFAVGLYANVILIPGLLTLIGQFKLSLIHISEPTRPY